MSSVPEWTADQLLRLSTDKTRLWITPACRTSIPSQLEFQQIESLDEVATEVETLLVAGGGKMMDQAKYFRSEFRTDLQLICIPTIFGSGAEVSPVTVLQQNEEKLIRIDDRFLPDARIYLLELSKSLSAEAVRNAIGDVWSHTMEGFLSPLADKDLRTELAGLISQLISTPLANTSEWFNLSACACEGQARSGVGLIHGFAHVLEGPLNTGHAHLCRTFFKPVMHFNRTYSDHWKNLCMEYDLDQEALIRVEDELFDPVLFKRTQEVLKDYWITVLRDRCTRINSVLVRRSHLGFFLEKDFA